MDVQVKPAGRLLIAPVNSHGVAVCERCTPIVGDRAPYGCDLNAAPTVVLGEDCCTGSCPACGAVYEVPPSVAVAALSAEVARLRGMVDKLVAAHDAGRLPADRIGRKEAGQERNQ